MVSITQEWIPAGRINRPGKTNPMQYITIHETGNTAAGADARAHASYLRNVNAKVSWHYTVDSRAIYQHLPDNESAFHAGDGADGPGNARSIGIEICVNADGDFDKAVRNAAQLCRKLMAEHGIALKNIRQHNAWNGKDCPYHLRRSGWNAFLTLCAAAPDAIPSAWAKASWEKAVARGITDGLRPQAACTREELVTMLDRAGVLEG